MEEIKQSPSVIPVVRMENADPTEGALNIQNSDRSEADLQVVLVEDSCNAVIVLEDSDDEMDKTNLIKPPSNPDEIILDDIIVDRMDLNQEPDAHLQPEKNVNQIFIGNLPLSIKKVNVVKFFEKYGQITDVMFIRSKSRSKTICFLTYGDSQSLPNALATNGLFYGGHNFRVSPVGRIPVDDHRTIFVTNLAAGTSYQDLYDTFENCGPVKSQYFVKGKGKQCDCAYITFEFKESHIYALLMKNFIVIGRKVTVLAYNKHRENRGLSNKIV